jgi:cytochrome b561
LRYAPRILHAIGARLLAALLLHVGVALHHHFVRRDGALRRMWPFGAPTGPS